MGAAVPCPLPPFFHVPMPSSSVPDVSASHSRKQTALEVTIQVIDTTKDLVPSELVKGLLSVMSGILTMLQVRTRCGILYSHYGSLHQQMPRYAKARPLRVYWAINWRKLF